MSRVRFKKKTVNGLLFVVRLFHEMCLVPCQPCELFLRCLLFADVGN